MLRIEVTDDGGGGADPANGTGLPGVERRVATFDGILAVSSPAGGPTIVVMEVPCALSSPKTFSSSGRGMTGCSRRTGVTSRRGRRCGPHCCKRWSSGGRMSRSSMSGSRPVSPTKACARRWAARQQIPGLPVLVLSQYVEQLYARELLADQAGGVGYLLKDRVFSDDQFVDVLRTVAAGGTVMDPRSWPSCSAAAPRRAPRPLSHRERQVLELMAEGRSNSAIANRSSSRKRP